MTWEDIMKKKKGTPWPKRITKGRYTYQFIKQKSGKATYGKLESSFRGSPIVDKKETIKVFKEDAIKNATRDYRQKMKDR